jgi:hypothetical protein
MAKDEKTEEVLLNFHRATVLGLSKELPGVAERPAIARIDGHD